MSSNATCPFCQAPLNVTEVPTGQPVVCPHCLTNIAHPGFALPEEQPYLVRDVRRSGHAITTVTWLLLGVGMVLAVGEIVLVHRDGRPETIESAILHSFMYGLNFTAIDVLVILAVARLFWRSFTAGQRTISAARSLGVAMLIVAFALSVVAFLFAVCQSLN